MSKLEKEWILMPSDRQAALALAQRLKISPVTAQILLNLGISEPESAARFLKPDLNHLHKPERFNNMDRAVARIQQAVENDENILVYGDYDVDGTTATALMVHFFRMLGKEVDYYIPHRQEEGYGLNCDAIEEFREQGVQLLITVDCGISSVEEVALANSHGIDIIITDHHEPPEVVPDAHTILNPKHSDCAYPWSGLCGVAVAFKLCEAMAAGFSQTRKLSTEYERFLIDSMGLVAVGTVADVVPLRDENRVLVAYGLEALRHTRIPGLQAMLERIGLTGKKIEASDVGFRIGPRLNAGGRMAGAARVVELFTTDDPRRAGELLDELEDANKERQRIERRILRQAEKQIEERSRLGRDSAFVLASEDWHSGVIGIVASRIVDKHYRPTVMVALEGDVGKGSARSVRGFNLFDAMSHCQDDLVQFGGHEMAAGMKLERNRLDAFTERFEAYATENLTDGDLRPKLTLNMEVELADVNRAFVHEYELLSPFGSQNRKPVFLSTDLKVAGQVKRIGKNQNHLSFYVNQNGTALRALAWGAGDRFEELSNAHSVSLAFTPQINRWQGRENVEIEVKDFKCE
jgi:single-stranded-DNA-specific exonuclease